MLETTNTNENQVDLRSSKKKKIIIGIQMQNVILDVKTKEEKIGQPKRRTK